MDAEFLLGGRVSFAALGRVHIYAQGAALEVCAGEEGDGALGFVRGGEVGESVGGVAA